MSAGTAAVAVGLDDDDEDDEGVDIPPREIIKGIIAFIVMAVIFMKFIAGVL